MKNDHSQITELSSPKNSATSELTQKKYLLRQLSIIAFGVILALIIFELTFRAIGTGERKEKLVRSDRPGRFYVPPGTPDGRNSNLNPAKPKGTFRIVVVGDSFTYGAESQYDDNFAKRLERMLKLNPSGRPVEVLNLGYPGYSTAQESLVVSAALSKFSPDLIILQVTLNDPELEPYRVSTAEKRKKLDDFFGRFPFNHLLGFKYLAIRIFNTITHSDYNQYYFDLFSNRLSWGRFSESMEHIVKSCNSTKTPLAVVIFPLFSHALDNSYPFKPLHEKIKELLTTLDVTPIDLLSAYNGIPHERLQAEPGVDSHPNEIAHRIAADTIFYELFHRHILPEELKAERVDNRRRFLPVDHPPTTIGGIRDSSISPVPK